MIGVPGDLRRRRADEATYLSGPSALSFVNLRQGKPVQMSLARGSRRRTSSRRWRREIVRELARRRW